MYRESQERWLKKKGQRIKKKKPRKRSEVVIDSPARSLGTPNAHREVHLGQKWSTPGMRAVLPVADLIRMLRWILESCCEHCIAGAMERKRN